MKQANLSREKQTTHFVKLIYQFCSVTRLENWETKRGQLKVIFSEQCAKKSGGPFYSSEKKVNKKKTAAKWTNIIGNI